MPWMQSRNQLQCWLSHSICITKIVGWPKRAKWNSCKEDWNKIATDRKEKFQKNQKAVFERFE